MDTICTNCGVASPVRTDICECGGMEFIPYDPAKKHKGLAPMEVLEKHFNVDEKQQLKEKQEVDVEAIEVRNKAAAKLAGENLSNKVEDKVEEKVEDKKEEKVVDKKDKKKK